MAALFFVGSALTVVHRLAGQLPDFTLALTLGDAGFGFLVKLLRLGRRAALVMDAAHDDIKMHMPPLDAETVTHVDSTRRFDALAVEVHLAAADRFAGQGAGLEKPGRPEPFVQSDRIRHCLYYAELMKRLSVILILLLPATQGLAEDSLDIELDPYYSNAGYFVSLTDKPIPVVQTSDEYAVYERLFHSAFSLPRFIVFEASVNPLPLLGVFVKRHYPGTYERAEISDNLNLVQVFTEGFEEPYALSVFMGSVVKFVRASEKTKAKNKGYSGYLLSIGSKHIVNNTLVDDDWLEAEWKIKGDQDFENKTLSWSMRVGAKIHGNDNITDVIYFALRRNHLDTQSADLSWFDNSDIEYKIAINKDDYTLVEQSLFINKKWPVPFMHKSAFELGVGFILEKNKYTGLLQTQADDFRLILRPSFAF